MGGGVLQEGALKSPGEVWFVRMNNGSVVTHFPLVTHFPEMSPARVGHFAEPRERLRQKMTQTISFAWENKALVTIVTPPVAGMGKQFSQSMCLEFFL